MNVFESCSDRTFVTYKKPPVNEVVCGIRFQQPEELAIPHVGMLWDKFRKDYPRIQHSIPIATAPDQFPLDKITGFPLPRVWFINEQDNQLVQFQFDRLYYNWRYRNDVYPRYLSVIKNFESTLDTFEIFLKEFNLGVLTPVECDLTYINHIEKGAGWNSIAVVSKIFKDFTWQHNKFRFLPNPVGIFWEVRYPLPDKKGHLIAKLRQATRADDKTPLLILEMITRGSGESMEREDLRKWFDVAHEWIVCGFADITTEEVQTKVWERENA